MNTKEQYENNVIDAEKCIIVARMAIANHDVERAKRILLKSISIHTLHEAEELLEELKNKHDCKDQIRLTGSFEQAQECIVKAQSAFVAGNRKKALRMLTKSERIYPTAKAKDLLREVKTEMLENGEDPDEVLKEVRKCTSRDDSEVATPQPKKREATSEQIKEIQRVLKASNDYDILGIPKGATLNEVKKAFRQLTLLLHPDKNNDPGARDAVVKLNNATMRLQTKLNKQK